YLGLRDAEHGPHRRRAARPPAAERPRCHFPNRCEPVPDPCAEPVEPEPPRLPALLLEHWRLRRWLAVGAGRLGDDSVPWGEALVNRNRLDDRARRGVARLIRE